MPCLCFWSGRTVWVAAQIVAMCFVSTANRPIMVSTHAPYKVVCDYMVFRVVEPCTARICLDRGPNSKIRGLLGRQIKP